MRAALEGLCWVGSYSWNECNSIRGIGGGITAARETVWLGTEKKLT